MTFCLTIRHGEIGASAIVAAANCTATEDHASVFSTQKVKVRRVSRRLLMGQRCATSGRVQVDIQDKENEIVVYADTPGMTNADVRVRFSCWRLFPS